MSIEVVRLEIRRLDSTTAPVLRQCMAAAWDTGATVVALDFSDVVYVDSLGISALISEQRRKPKEAKIVLCSLTDYVRDVLEVTQLFKVFDVYESASAAVAAQTP